MKRLKGLFGNPGDGNSLPWPEKPGCSGSKQGNSKRNVSLSNRKHTGDIGESLAVDFLKKLGYRIVETNFRCRQGEIDIVARHKECLVFVEVRTKKGGSFGLPEESLTLSKRERLKSLADIYIQSLPEQPDSWRIDVVAVELTPDNRVARLEHIENAVS